MFLEKPFPSPPPVFPAWPIMPLSKGMSRCYLYCCLLRGHYWTAPGLEALCHSFPTPQSSSPALYSLKSMGDAQTHSPYWYPAVSTTYHFYSRRLLWSCHINSAFCDVDPDLDKQQTKMLRDFPGGSVGKNLSANAGDMGSIPGPGRSHMPRSN